MTANPDNPMRLKPEALADLLGVDAGTIERHVEDGAPTDDAGCLHVIHYAAWLINQIIT